MKIAGIIIEAWICALMSMTWHDFHGVELESLSLVTLLYSESYT